jgi:pimeloyl-ACP methyl ester carboxylesterase
MTLIPLAATLVLGYVILCAAMFALQRSLLYYPQPRSLPSAKSAMKLLVPGAQIVVTMHECDGPHAVVYFGGNAEDVSLNLDTFVEAFPDRSIYLMHYRGYGGSTGKPTEAVNVADAIALVDKVRHLHPKISVMGRSLGSGVAVQVASKTEVSRLVLITPFDSIVEIAARIYPFLPVRLLALDKYESGKFAPLIRTPTTIIEAEHDQEIPHTSTHKLLGRFRSGVATHKLIRGVGHNDLDLSDEYIHALRAALA